MKISDEVKFVLLMTAVILSMVAAFFQPKYPVTYDCRISEISPDVPPAVKEQCRKRQQRWIQPQRGL